MSLTASVIYELLIEHCKEQIKKTQEIYDEETSFENVNPYLIGKISAYEDIIKKYKKCID